MLGYSQRHTANFGSEASEETWNLIYESVALAAKRVLGIPAAADHQSATILELFGSGGVADSEPCPSKVMTISPYCAGSGACEDFACYWQEQERHDCFVRRDEMVKTGGRYD